MNSPQTESVRLPDLISRYLLKLAESDAFAREHTLAQLYHSTALDGSGLVPAQIASLLDTHEINSVLTSSQLMVIDYQQGQDLISGWSINQQPLSLLDVQRLGACVMHHTGGLTPQLLQSVDSRLGEWRTYEVIGTSGSYERPHKLQKALLEVIKQTNTSLQGKQTLRQLYETSFRLHYELIRIHPFAEGNGRVARLLMNYVQQYRRQPQSVVFIEDRLSYLGALDLAFRSKSIRPFDAFMFGQLTKLVSTDGY